MNTENCGHCGSTLHNESVCEREPSQPDAICYCRPGMTNEGPALTQLPDGQWQAVAKIGSLFGSEVEGECRGTGATKEEALASLKKDQDNLYAGLWY